MGPRGVRVRFCRREPRVGLGSSSLSLFGASRGQLLVRLGSDSLKPRLQRCSFGTHGFRVGFGRGDLCVRLGGCRATLLAPGCRLFRFGLLTRLGERFLALLLELSRELLAVRLQPQSKLALDFPPMLSLAHLDLLQTVIGDRLLTDRADLTVVVMEHGLKDLELLRGKAHRTTPLGQCRS